MAPEPRLEARSAPTTGLGWDERPDESAVTPYLRALRAHWLLALLVFLTIVGAAAAYTSVRSETYQADAELLVNPIPRDDVTLISLPLVKETGDPTRTIQTAAELVDSHDAADRAARRLGDGWTRHRVENATEVSPQGQTNILEITATAGTAREAAAVANAFAEAALEVRSETLRPLAVRAQRQVREQLEALSDPRSPAITELERARGQLDAILAGQDPSLSVSQLAVPPRSALGLAPWLVLALAALAGLVLAAGTALLTDVLTPDRISSEEELRSTYPMPILSRIPKLPRRRVRPQPETLDMDPLVREAFRTLHVQLDSTGARRRAIMVTSASRGDGKTTSSANLALEIAATGALVIAVDADLRKPDLARQLGLGDGPVAADPDRVEAPTDDPLKPVPGQPSMWVLELAELVEMHGPERSRSRIQGLISGLLGAVDYVVVDTAPLGEVSDALMILDEVDDVVLVSRLGNTRKLSLEFTREMLTRVGVQPTGAVVIGGRTSAGRYPYG